MSVILPFSMERKNFRAVRLRLSVRRQPSHGILPFFHCLFQGSFYTGLLCRELGKPDMVGCDPGIRYKGADLSIPLFQILYLFLKRADIALELPEP